MRRLTRLDGMGQNKGRFRCFASVILSQRLQRLHDIRYLRFRSLRVFASPYGPVPHRQELRPANPGCNTVTVTVRPR